MNCTFVSLVECLNGSQLLNIDRAGIPDAKNISDRNLHIVKKGTGQLFQDRRKQGQNTSLVLLSYSSASRVHKKLKNQS